MTIPNTCLVYSFNYSTQTWPFSNADSVKARVNQAVRDVTAQLTSMHGDSTAAELKVANSQKCGELVKYCMLILGENKSNAWRKTHKKVFY